MSVQFILGTSGTGKTRTIYDQIVERLTDARDETGLILLVPEQATYQAEREILSYPDINGFSRLKVLSFNRLGFMLGGRHVQNRTLDKTAAEMVISKILNELGDELKIFKPIDPRAGIGKKVSGLITEFVHYDHQPEDIQTLAETLQTQGGSKITILKLRELANVYKRYLDFLEQNDFLDPDRQLSYTIEKISNADFIKNSQIWIDGFSDFSSQELSILYEMLKSSNDAKISLCLDPHLLGSGPSQNHDISIFAPTLLTYQEMCADITNRLKLNIDKPIILNDNKRFAVNPALKHLESSIFKDDPRTICSDGNVKIITAHDRRAEVIFAAREICKLIRKNNYRYRDIAIIVSNLDEYSHFIRSAFNDYNIPFFLDTRYAMSQHPAAEFIFSSLSIAINDLSRRDLFAYLKSGYADVDRADAAVLENYCFAFDLKAVDFNTSTDWRHQTKKPTFDLKKINSTRHQAVNRLKKLCSDLNGKTITADGFANVLIEFLNDHKYSAKLSRMDDQQISGQFTNNLLNLLNQIKQVYQQTEMDGKEFAEIFLNTFGDLDFARIPPKLDQVLIGSIERSRHPDIKAAFLIGATQKYFPSPLSRDSLLNEAERQYVQSNDFELSATLNQQLLSRQYLAYIAFTRPSEKLYITCPAIDEKGTLFAKSHFLNSLEQLYNDNINSAYKEDDLPNSYSRKEFLDRLCLTTGADSTDTFKAATRLLAVTKIDRLKEFADFAETSANYNNNATLDEKLANEIFPNKLKTSVSRLQTFASCPFKYFAQYVLRLEKKLDMKIKPVDIGDFYHDIIDRVSKTLIERGEDFGSINFDDLKSIIDNTIKKYLEETNFVSSFYSHSVHNAFIIEQACEILEQFFAALCKQGQISRFKLKQTEIDFGFDNCENEFEIPLNTRKSVVIRGKIDRLDMLGDDGIVIDYKKTGKPVSWQGMYYGLDLQLGVYLLAGKYTGAFNPAGAFYMPIERKVIELNDKFDFKLTGIFDGRFAGLIDTQTETGFSQFYNFSYSKKDDQYSRYGSSGALKKDDYQNVLKFIEHKIKSIASDIVSGKIPVHPYRVGNVSPCGYCDYMSVCRFDWQINDYNFLEQKGKLEILEELSDA